jgi:hypothetical protein
MFLGTAALHGANHDCNTRRTTWKRAVCLGNKREMVLHMDDWKYLGDSYQGDSD